MTNILTQNPEASAEHEEISRYIDGIKQKIDQSPTLEDGEIFHQMSAADGSSVLLMRSADCTYYAVSTTNAPEYEEDMNLYDESFMGKTGGASLTFTGDLKIVGAEITAIGSRGGSFEHEINKKRLLGFVKNMSNALGE
jgi:hypothetical protein